MAVFARYNPRGVGRGDVLRQAHPNVGVQPWVPLKTTVRTDNQWGGRLRVHRVQPNERGKTWPSTLVGSWTNNASFADTTNPASGNSNNETPVIPGGPNGGVGPSMSSCGCSGGGCGGMGVEYLNRR